jgi:hypothetical protein
MKTAEKTEIVIWKSADGTWGIGQYPAGGQDYRRLTWVRTGHATRGAALDAYDEAHDTPTGITAHFDVEPRWCDRLAKVFPHHA